MKRLNKLLLAGAALAGALVPKVGAFADIKVNDIITEFSKVNKKSYNLIKDDIENNHDIELTGFVWGSTTRDRVRYYILKGLQECLKIPIIKEDLKEYKSKEGKKFKIILEKNPKKDNESTMGETGWDEITLYSPALTEKNIIIQGNKRFKSTGHKFALEFLNTSNMLTQDQIDMSHIQSTLTHELGHFVSNIEEAKRNEKTIGSFENDDSNNQRWLIKFYGEYYHDLKNNKKLKEFPWDNWLESEYGNEKLEDWFAESFSNAVLPGKNLGETEVSKQFEETLSKLSNVRNCLTV